MNNSARVPGEINTSANHVWAKFWRRGGYRIETNETDFETIPLCPFTRGRNQNGPNAYSCCGGTRISSMPPHPPPAASILTSIRPEAVWITPGIYFSISGRGRDNSGALPDSLLPSQPHFLPNQKISRCKVFCIEPPDINSDSPVPVEGKRGWSGCWSISRHSGRSEVLRNPALGSDRRWIFQNFRNRLCKFGKCIPRRPFDRRGCQYRRFGPDDGG